jgi:hypothetical protein
MNETAAAAGEPDRLTALAEEMLLASGGPMTPAERADADRLLAADAATDADRPKQRRGRRLHSTLGPKPVAVRHVWCKSPRVPAYRAGMLRGYLVTMESMA